MELVECSNDDQSWQNVVMMTLIKNFKKLVSCI